MSQAAENGDKAVVELLLKNGAQPDFEDEKGRTPLSRAIEGDELDEEDEVDEGDEREHAVVVQLLLAEGVKVNYRYELVSKSSHIRIGRFILD